MSKGAFVAAPVAVFARRLAILFALQASLVILLLAILVPPFENSDEYNHFERADQISRLGLIATRFAGPLTSGGMTDPGINRVDDIIGSVRFHPERKVTAAMLRRADAIGWHGGTRLSFLNTAVYAPFLYLPSVPALWAGKLLRLPIDRTLVLSRISEGLCAVLVASLAIAGAGEAALLLFTVLCFPMCLSLFASVSQDGLMLAFAAAVVALVRRVHDRPDAGGRLEFAGLCVCLLLLGLGRPAYAPFAVLPLLLPGLPRRLRVLGGVAIVAGIGAWSLVTVLVTMANGSGDRGVAPGAQLLVLLHHPARLGPLAWNTFSGRQGMEGETYLHEMIGVLGWIDTRMPSWFYLLATMVLAWVVAVSLVNSRPVLRARGQGIMALAALLSVGLVFLLLYLTWSPFGFPFVDGVQGRYFLPVLLLVPLFLPALGSARPWDRLAPLRWVAVTFGPLSMVVTIVSVVHRYYI